MDFQQKAWNDYIVNGHESTETEMLYQPILSSWQRCCQLHRDYRHSPERSASPEELQARLAENERLIRVAKPFLEELYIFVQGTGFMVALLDKDACMLQVMGDPELLQRFDHFCVGEFWDEDTKGTNAMGVALIEKQPLQVYGWEHYFADNHGITCSAAPIFGENRQLLGLLDLTGDYHKASVHTLGMVVAAVKAIQNELRLDAAHSELVKAYNNVNAIIETISDGIISFDSDGIITNINPVTLSFLDREAYQCVGKKLSYVLNNDALQHEILNFGRQIFDREIVLDQDNKQHRFLASGQPIIDRQQEICGGVITLREIKHIHKLVTKMVGARAQFSFDDIIGQSRRMLESIKLAKYVASGNSSVILQGESGTGKEMFAQAIHNWSEYNQGPFVALNCGAIPRDLIESELFGYEEGSFTGGRRGGQAGKFELAQDGTIFLDEIADMPLDTQVSLLRVIQEKQVVRIGGYRPILINVRIIAATNRNLKEEVQKGNFRRDLYYRLNVININIPPLREREGDVLLIANYFLRKISKMLGFVTARITPEAETLLENYSWPGNVRELANAMERAVNMARGDEIRPEHLPDGLQTAAPVIYRESGPTRLSDAERQIIVDTLRSTGGNITHTAALLGVARNTLYRKIRNYGIEGEEYMGG